MSRLRPRSRTEGCILAAKGQTCLGIPATLRLVPNGSCHVDSSSHAEKVPYLEEQVKGVQETICWLPRYRYLISAESPATINTLKAAPSGIASRSWLKIAHL